MPLHSSPRTRNPLHYATAEVPEPMAAVFARLGLVGESPALQAVFEQAYQVGKQSDSPVLIVGPSGTGKSRLAQAIHALDPLRRDNPFITVNCAAVGKELADSELFGQRPSKGASKSGLLRRASGGTLLLDEVSELDPELQPRLLRVLTERGLLPAAKVSTNSVDVRIVGLAARPLGPLVAHGCFAAELWERLSASSICISPLRDRPEDIAPQARHFLKTHRRSLECKVADFTTDVIEAFQQLPWEGNTRQLENLIRETLVRKHGGTVIERADLPQRVREILARLPSLNPPESCAANDPMDDLLRKACEQRWTLRQAMKEVDRLLPFRPRA